MGSKLVDTNNVIVAFILLHFPFILLV